VVEGFEPLQGGGGGGTLYESRHGRYMPASGMVRALVVLVELEYLPGATNPDPFPNGTSVWPAHALPTWVGNVDPTQNLLDHDPPLGEPIGQLTRYLYQASSGNFLLLGDYLLAPDNGGIFKITTTTGNALGATATVLAAVNNALGTTLTTVHGYSQVTDFDRWTISNTGPNGPGLPKTLEPENPNRYDHVVIVYRNARDVHSGSGRVSASSPGLLLGQNANSYSQFGGGDRLPVKLMCHEFCHLLFGSNNFHCAGGGNTGGSFYVHQYWVSQVGGWSLMGLANRSMDSWCGWDRLRMGWRNQDQVNEIAARNAINTAEVNGDLDPLQPGDAGVYALARFRTNGRCLEDKAALYESCE